MPIYWTLKTFMESREITTPELSRAVKVSLNTIYTLRAREEAVGKLDVKTVDLLLVGLGELTGELLEYEHILRFVPPEDSE